MDVFVTYDARLLAKSHFQHILETWRGKPCYQLQYIDLKRLDPYLQKTGTAASIEPPVVKRNGLSEEK
jgi:hypothetical protein